MKVNFEQLVLEGLGLLFVGGASFAVTQFVTLTPYNMNLSKMENNAYFCMIPLAVYLAYRVFFGFGFFLSSLLPSNLKYLGE